MAKKSYKTPISNWKYLNIELIFQSIFYADQMLSLYLSKEEHEVGDYELVVFKKRNLIVLTLFFSKHIQIPDNI